MRSEPTELDVLRRALDVAALDQALARRLVEVLLAGEPPPAEPESPRPKKKRRSRAAGPSRRPASAAEPEAPAREAGEGERLAAELLALVGDGPAGDATLRALGLAPVAVTRWSRGCPCSPGALERLRGAVRSARASKAARAG